MHKKDKGNKLDACKVDLIMNLEAILNGRQTHLEIFQCLYGNLMSNNFHKKIAAENFMNWKL